MKNHKEMIYCVVWFKEISNEEKSDRNMINWNSTNAIFHRQRVDHMHIP